MQIKQMTLTQFGLYENQSIDYLAHLNVWAAPNESGKTTLLYAIQHMLYGCDTHDVYGYQGKININGKIFVKGEEYELTLRQTNKAKKTLPSLISSIGTTTTFTQRSVSQATFQEVFHMEAAALQVMSPDQLVNIERHLLNIHAESDHRSPSNVLQDLEEEYKKKFSKRSKHSEYGLLEQKIKKADQELARLHEHEREHETHGNQIKASEQRLSEVKKIQETLARRLEIEKEKQKRQEKCQSYQRMRNELRIEDLPKAIERDEYHRAKTQWESAEESYQEMMKLIADVEMKQRILHSKLKDPIDQRTLEQTERIQKEQDILQAQADTLSHELSGNLTEAFEGDPGQVKLGYDHLGRWQKIGMVSGLLLLIVFSVLVIGFLFEWMTWHMEGLIFLMLFVALNGGIWCAIVRSKKRLATMLGVSSKELPDYSIWHQRMEHQVKGEQQQQRVRFLVEQIDEKEKSIRGLLEKYHVTTVGELREQRLLIQSINDEMIKNQEWLRQALEKKHHLETEIALFRAQCRQFEERIQGFLGSTVKENLEALEHQWSLYKKMEDLSKEAPYVKTEQPYLDFDALQIEHMAQDIISLQKEEKELLQTITRLKTEQRGLYANIQENIREQVVVLQAQKKDMTESQKKYDLLRHILRQQMKQYTEDNAPKYIFQASTYFSTITSNMYLRILKQEDGTLQLQRSDHSFCDIDTLSLGTKKQLAFALRLALADVIDPEGVYPLLLDDVFAYWDTQRMKQGLSIFNDSYARQVFYVSARKDSEAVAHGFLPMKWQDAF